MSDDARWGELFADGNRGPVAVLAGGVLLYAVDSYVVSAVLPSVIAEIGGGEFYAWVATVYLLAAVVTASSVSRLLALASARSCYLAALACFALGSVVDAVAGSMTVLLAGRVLQGLGGGLLAGLAYAVMRDALPRSLWTRGSATMSMMWGVGLVVGPALGGLAADLGAWRWSFGVLAVAAVVVAAVVPRAIGDRREDGAAGAYPVVSVVLLGLATAVVSVAGLDGRAVPTAIGLVVALGLLAVFWRWERGRQARLLPAAAFRRGRAVRGVYPVIAVLTAAATVELFVPLFAQRTAGLGPLPAGFASASLAVGWVLAELAAAGVAASRRPTLVAAGPAVLVGGLVVVAATQDLGPVGPAVWVLGLVAAGAGVGIAWPHLTVAAIGADPGDGDRAAASLTTLQMLATALGTAVSGVAVAVGGADDLLAARMLYLVWAGLAALVTVVAWPTARRLRHEQRAASSADT